MMTISEKIARGQKRFVDGAPKLVREMTQQATRYFKTDVFRKEGFDVHPNKRWSKRVNEEKRTTSILIGEIRGGKMRRSIRGSSSGIVGVVQTDVPYARWHQEGTPNMTMRKFLGESEILNRKFDKKILNHIRKSLEG